jgi:hypothetical protein
MGGLLASFDVDTINKYAKSLLFYINKDIQ